MLPKEFTKNSSGADIHISSDGKFLYASNRGHNSIVIFTINLNNGKLTPIDYVNTKGDGPRNLSLSPDEKIFAGCKSEYKQYYFI